MKLSHVGCTTMLHLWFVSGHFAACSDFLLKVVYYFVTISTHGSASNFTIENFHSQCSFICSVTKFDKDFHIVYKVDVYLMFINIHIVPSIKPCCDVENS